MSVNRSGNTRLVVIALLAVAVLLALVVATGGGLSSSGSAPPAAAPAPAQSTPGPVGRVVGTVTVQARHLSGNTWHFRYVIQNTGTEPIAGFQLSAPRSNLFHIKTRLGWSYFGSGVCGGNPAGILIYWSTNGNVIPPKKRAHFAFDVNTTGFTTVDYALSWGTAAPAFGKVQGPVPSSLPTAGPCR